jgi:pSer/pThr/pTyr-binding forkhead associated (FHA) protein
MPTKSIDRDFIASEAMATKPSVPEGPDLETGAILGLRVLSAGTILSLIGRDNFTLGRAVEGQAIIPDIDLESYDAYEHGISRIHAEIRVVGNDIQAVDLDSANGTLVNGQRLEPQVPQSIQHGDIIQLGKLRLQLISRYRG